MGIYEHGQPGWGAFRQNKGVSGPNYIANPNVWIEVDEITGVVIIRVSLALFHNERGS